MKDWSDWESIRHQVALYGRVLDVHDRPVAGAQVTITAMPEEFSVRVKGAASAAGTGWEELNERPDRTLSRTDGIFYFLDLPAGRYTVKGIDATSGSQGKETVSVKWVENDKIKIAVADLRLSTA